MKKIMYRKIFWLALVTFLLLFCTKGFSGQCTPALKKAMSDYGLTEQAIEKICANADTIRTERPEITVEKIEADITGRIVGTWIFQPKEWREIDIAESKYKGDKARIIIDLDTIRNKGGQLKMIYKWIEGKWELSRIINMSFQ